MIQMTRDTGKESVPKLRLGCYSCGTFAFLRYRKEISKQRVCRVA